VVSIARAGANPISPKLFPNASNTHPAAAEIKIVHSFISLNFIPKDQDIIPFMQQLSKKKNQLF